MVRRNPRSGHPVARSNLNATAEAIAQDKTRVEEERTAVRAYQRPSTTPPPSAVDRSALGDIDHALSDTRLQRVVAAGDDRTSDLSTAFGPRPTNPAGRETWSAIAERIETCLDQRPPVDSLTARRSRITPFDHLLGPRPLNGGAHEWDRVAQLVDRSQQFIAHAIDSDHVPPAQALDDPARWQAVLELIDRAVRVETPTDSRR